MRLTIPTSDFIIWGLGSNGTANRLKLISLKIQALYGVVNEVRVTHQGERKLNFDL